VSEKHEMFKKPLG